VIKESSDMDDYGDLYRVNDIEVARVVGFVDRDTYQPPNNKP
jgi:hypothetical protein